ncbi:DUF4129 domain-containing protein [Eisenibacter elegans]|jgi:hypothetical protein|uniref:DUF4129 domain-containing protein n=1 Tax=Eisenibacter elegans TaxID=997 RepID=UPI00042111DB|nr:DUF4129 domain-containing protein [Eisenibacter elegans]
MKKHLLLSYPNYFWVGLVCVLLWGTSATTFAQKHQTTATAKTRKFDEEALKRYYQDPEFDYLTKTKQVEFDDTPTWYENLLMQWYYWRMRISDAILNPSWDNPLSILTWSLFACLAALIVLKLLNANIGLFAHKKNLYNSSIDNLHEPLPSAQSLEALIQKALKEQAYAEALRWQYLALIEQLISQGWLRKELQRTNNEYLIQLTQHPHYEQIRACTQLFEYGYYGGFPIQSTHWEHARSLFMAIQPSKPPKT